MAKISDNTIQCLKEIPIEDVAEYCGIQVKRHMAVCPFHADKNPSLRIGGGQNNFHCFGGGCSAKGDTIELVKKCKNCTFQEACETLAGWFGIPIQRDDKKPTKYPQSREKTVDLGYKPSETDQIRISSTCEYNPLKFSAVYQRFYDLCSEPNEELKGWWRKRGFSNSLLKEAGWRIITPQTWTELAKTYNESVLVESGLEKAENGQIEPAWRRGHRVVVPFFNGTLDSMLTAEKPVLYLKARNLGEGTKYLTPRKNGDTSPETAMPLFGFDVLYEWLCTNSSTEPLFITESETDALAVRELGKMKGKKAFSVAICGATNTTTNRETGGYFADANQKLILRELVHAVKQGDMNAQIYVATDKDDSGNGFAHDVLNALWQAGFSKDHLHRWQPWANRDGMKDVGDFMKALKQNADTKQNAEPLQQVANNNKERN